MWKPVTKGNESLGFEVNTIGELKELLNHIPKEYDHFILFAEEDTYGMAIDTEEEMVIMETVEFLEELLEQQEHYNK